MRINSQSTRHLSKQWLYKCYKVHEHEIETDQAENTENAERRRTNIPKE